MPLANFIDHHCGDEGNLRALHKQFKSFVDELLGKHLEGLGFPVLSAHSMLKVLWHLGTVSVATYADAQVSGHAYLEAAESFSRFKQLLQCRNKALEDELAGMVAPTPSSRSAVGRNPLLPESISASSALSPALRKVVVECIAEFFARASVLKESIGEQEKGDIRKAIIASLIDEEQRRNRLNDVELVELAQALSSSLLDERKQPVEAAAASVLQMDAAGRRSPVISSNPLAARAEFAPRPTDQANVRVNPLSMPQAIGGGASGGAAGPFINNESASSSVSSSASAPSSASGRPRKLSSIFEREQQQQDDDDEEEDATIAYMPAALSNKDHSGSSAFAAAHASLADSVGSGSSADTGSKLSSSLVSSSCESGGSKRSLGGSRPASFTTATFQPLASRKLGILPALPGSSGRKPEPPSIPLGKTPLPAANKSTPTSTAPAPLPSPSPPPPGVADREAHFRQQRDLLLSKKQEERAKALKAYEDRRKSLMQATAVANSAASGKADS